jgi:hypothetical protein
MNNKLVPIIIVLVLLAGGGYYFKTKHARAPQTAGLAMNEANEFAGAIESGKPTLCTLTKDSDVMEYFIKGKKIRINTTTNTEGKVVVAHMISDETYFYAWDDTQKQGTKMSLLVPSPSPLASVASEPVTPKFDESDYQDFKDQGYTISCKAGPVADSAFTPPSDVKFIDPSQMMQAVPSPDAAGQYDMSKLKELQQQYDGDQ